MFLAQPKRARLLVLQEHTNPAQDNRVCDDADAGYYVPTSGQPKRARLLVLREPIKQAQDNPRVTMLMQGYYVPSSGQSSQTACAVGTYNPAQDNPRVIELMRRCRAGYYVSNLRPIQPDRLCRYGRNNQASTGQSIL